MRWMSTSRKQARVRGCSARSICSTRAQAFERAWRNSTYNPFSKNIVAVKQCESKLLHRSALCDARRAPESCKTIVPQDFSKYLVILRNNSSIEGESMWYPNGEIVSESSSNSLNRNWRSGVRLSCGSGF
jgi:hypothetical protein